MASFVPRFEFAEMLSLQSFRREIPQVLLIHANQLNANTLDTLLTLLERRGYRFITLDQALADPAYQTRDEYVGPAGISWLRRWQPALGKKMDQVAEPAPPNWVLELYQKLHAPHVNP